MSVWNESAHGVGEAVNEWEISTGVKDSDGKIQVEVKSIVELTLKLGLFVSDSLSLTLTSLSFNFKADFDSNFATS